MEEENELGKEDSNAEQILGSLYRGVSQWTQIISFSLVYTVDLFLDFYLNAP